MSIPPVSFLSLPTEVRDQIYVDILQHRIDREFPRNPYRIQPVGTSLHYTEKPRIFLRSPNSSELPPTLTAVAPIAQVNKKIREEILDALGNTMVDVEARVVNFDFGHVIHFLSSLGRRRQDDFCVRADGTSGRSVKIKLCGPYNDGWRHTLKQWTDMVNRLVPPPGELAAFHNIGGDLAFPRLHVHLPDGLVKEVFSIYQACSSGASRLALDKIFYTLLTKHQEGQLAETGRWTNRGLHLDEFWS